MREFIPNIDTANEEIERLESRVAELETELAVTKKHPQKTTSHNQPTDMSFATARSPFLFGSALDRAVAANQSRQPKPRA